MENEIWKTITGFENYEISETRKIRNIKHGNILKPHISDKGYYVVTLRANGKQ